MSFVCIASAHVTGQDFPKMLKDSVVDPMKPIQIEERFFKALDVYECD
jgi:hypothetical protein